MNSEAAQAVIDKVIDKLVRITVTDGRIFLGKLRAVDQTKTVFIQDALELMDKEDEHYIHHDVLTCCAIDLLVVLCSVHIHLYPLMPILVYIDLRSYRTVYHYHFCS